MAPRGQVNRLGDTKVLSNFDRSRLWLRSSVDVDSRHVVVADPDESVFAMVRQLTAPDIWRVAYAETSDGLLRVLRKSRVSLVLVELSMLDADPALAEELTSRARRGLRLVVTTDDHSESSERRARLIGPVYYAPKPVNVSLMSDVLAGALDAAV